MYVQFYGFNKEEEYLNNVIQRFPVFPVESKLLFAHPVNGLFAVGVFLDFARFEQIGNFALRRGFLDGVFGPSVFGRRSRIGLHIGRTLHSVKVLLGGVVMVVMMTSSDGSSAAASASAAVTDNVHLFFFVSSSSCFSEKKKSFLTFCSDGVEKSFPSFPSFLFFSLSLCLVVVWNCCWKYYGTFSPLFFLFMAKVVFLLPRFLLYIDRVKNARVWMVVQ